MRISIDEQQKIFHLQTTTSSYIMQIEEGNVLTHVYYGKKISEYNGSLNYARIDRSFSPNLPNSQTREFSLDTVLQEYGGVNTGDFRSGAIDLQFANGARASDFRYVEYRIQKGKPVLAGMPQSHIDSPEDAQTLILVLRDVSGVKLELFYTIFRDSSLIARSVRVINQSEQLVTVQKAMSAQIDFPMESLELMHFEGSWGRERMVVREPIHRGIKIVDSKRGTSSHQENSSILLVKPNTDEFTGEVYGLSLIYSGNHEFLIEKDQYQQTRVMAGINAHLFAWPLSVGESFQTPELLMNYSNQGMNQQSQDFHRFIQKHLVRSFATTDRPILLNNWEATYFDFDEEKLLNLADQAKKLGIELFVLDDGWYGKRNSDTTSLGDWYVDQKKLPNGLASLSKKIHQRGLKFGLWIEPEMISPISELFTEHPDWALQIPGRLQSPSRGQFVLDFSRDEVRKEIFARLATVIDPLELDYVKWDMNRNLTEVFSLAHDATEQGTIFHRYVLGMYAFAEELTNRYPNILFEGCSGGGGRFDLGMLYYMPQIWASDNTDAAARIRIQHGTSYFYPPATIAAHVSDIPNHQTGRMISMQTRGDVAMSGMLGYEVDLIKLSVTEKDEIRKQILSYKKHRELIQNGRFYRLGDPAKDNALGWQFVSDDQSETLLFYFRQTAIASGPLTVIKFVGLEESAVYEMENGLSYTGGELMQVGIYMDFHLPGDYVSQKYYFKKSGSLNVQISD